MGKIGVFEIILIVFVLSIFIVTPFLLVWYFITRARNKEKLLLIDKGIDLKELGFMQNKKNSFPWLKVGIVLTGIAIGCLVVSFVLIGPLGEKFNHMPGFSIGVIILFAGLSMILANFVDKAKDQK